MAILAKYSLNGNANDSSGNGFNGTATNITYPSGKVGPQSANFLRASPSKIVTPITDPGSAMSFSCMFKTTSVVSSGQEYTIYSKRNGTFTFQIVMSITDGTNKVGCNDWGVTGTRIASINPINDGKWHHLVFVMRNSTTAELYIDGNLQGTSSAFNFITQSFTNGNLLGDFNTGLRAFEGSIDEVIIRNNAPSVAQVKNEYLFYNGFM